MEVIEFIVELFEFVAWLLTFKLVRIFAASLGGSLILSGVVDLVLNAPALIPRGMTIAFGPSVLQIAGGALLVWVTLAPKGPQSRWLKRLPSDLPYDAEQPDEAIDRIDDQPQ